MGGPLRKYRYRKGTNTTVLKLSDSDAARMGLTEDDLVDVEPVAAMKAAAAPNRARGGAANKARTGALTKGRGAAGKAAKAAPVDPGPAVVAEPDGAGDAVVGTGNDGSDGAGGGD